MLLAHAARTDADVLWHLEATLRGSPQADSVTVLLAVLRPILPEDVRLIDVASGCIFVPFQPDGHATPMQSMPALCNSLGVWSRGFLAPCITAPEAVEAPHEATSFLESLSNLMPGGFVPALPPPGSWLTWGEICDMVGGLSTTLPQGVLIYNVDPPVVWWVVGGTYYHLEELWGDAPHLFLQRSLEGSYTSCVSLAAEQIHADWPNVLSFSACWCASWELACPTPDNCFFDALGLDRYITLTTALLAAQAMAADFRDLLLARLVSLFNPAAWINGADIQLLVNLLPSWFPQGILVLHGEGALLHFSSNARPSSVLPSASWLQSVLSFGGRV